MPRESLESIKLYLKDLRKIPALTDEEVITLIKKARRHKKERSRIKKRLIEGGLHLVVRAAKRYRLQGQLQGLSFSDLIEEGNLGLIKAIEAYKPAKGTFIQYAFPWINQAVQRALLNQTRTIRIPVYRLQTIGRWLNVSARLQKELGRVPTLKEVAKKLKISLKKIQKIVDAYTMAYKETSLDQPILDDENGLSLEDVVQDEKYPSPEEIVTLLKTDAEMHSALGILSPSEQKILKVRFGLEDHVYRSLRDAADVLGLSQTRVWQVERKALVKLRRHLARLNVENLSPNLKKEE